MKTHVESVDKCFQDENEGDGGEATSPSCTSNIMTKNKDWDGELLKGSKCGCQHGACAPANRPMLPLWLVLADVSGICIGVWMSPTTVEFTSTRGGRRKEKVCVIILSRGEWICPLKEMSLFGIRKESWNVKTFCKTVMPTNYLFGDGSKVSFRSAEQIQATELLMLLSHPWHQVRMLCVPLFPCESTSLATLWVLQCSSNLKTATAHQMAGFHKEK